MDSRRRRSAAVMVIPGCCRQGVAEGGDGGGAGTRSRAARGPVRGSRPVPGGGSCGGSHRQRTLASSRRILAGLPGRGRGRA